MLKNLSLPIAVPDRTSKLGLDFSLQSPEFYSCVQFEIEEDWSVDFVTL